MDYGVAYAAPIPPRIDYIPAEIVLTLGEVNALLRVINMEVMAITPIGPKGKEYYDTLVSLTHRLEDLHCQIISA